MKNILNSLTEESKANFLAIIVIIILSVFAFTSAYAQPKFPDGKEGILTIQGFVKDSLGHKIKSEVKIEILDVYDDTRNIIRTKNGNVIAGLWLNKEYTITFTCEGYANKTITFVTDVDMDFRNYFFMFDIIMLKYVPNSKVAEVFFEEKSNQFSYKLN